MTTRCDFEHGFARDRGETVEALGRRGWHSYLHGGDWSDICLPDDLPGEKRADLTRGMIALCRFGETPPTDGAGAG